MIAIVYEQIQSYNRPKGQAEHSFQVQGNSGRRIYVTVDKQGRILVPQDLRDFAGLEKDVVLSGMGSRIEVWSLEKWNEVNGEVDIDEISEGIGDMGLTI